MARSLYNSEKKTLGEVLQDVYPEVPFRIHNFIIKPSMSLFVSTFSQHYVAHCMTSQHVSRCSSPNSSHYVSLHASSSPRNARTARTQRMTPHHSHNHLQLTLITEGFFEDKENLRKFLENFAAKKGFDPLVFVNWQNVRKVDLFEVTVCIWSHLFFSLLLLFPLCFAYIIVREDQSCGGCTTRCKRPSSTCFLRSKLLRCDLKVIAPTLPSLFPPFSLPFPS